jgi:hypothetical protein
MITSFDAQQGPIVLAATLEGPQGMVELRLALDTGATDTAIGIEPLRSAGYDPLLASKLLMLQLAAASCRCQSSPLPS